MGDSRNSLYGAVQSRNGPTGAAANQERNADGGHSNTSLTAMCTVTDSGAGATEVCSSTSRNKLDLFGGMHLLQKII